MTEIELGVGYSRHLVGDSRLGTVRVMRSLATLARGAIRQSAAFPACRQAGFFTFLCGSTKKSKEEVGTIR